MEPLTAYRKDEFDKKDGNGHVCSLKVMLGDIRVQGRKVRRTRNNATRKRPILVLRADSACTLR